MDKKNILKTIMAELQREIDTLVNSALEAREAATSEESKAENKYDTRGLEASYLAGAQAKRAKEVAETLDYLQRLAMRDFDKTTPIEATALVEVEVDGEENKWFFMVPQQGGMIVDIKGTSVFTLSPDSPLGKLLFHNKVGETFEFVTKGESKDYEIVSVK